MAIETKFDVTTALDRAQRSDDQITAQEAINIIKTSQNEQISDKDIKAAFDVAQKKYPNMVGYDEAIKDMKSDAFAEDRGAFIARKRDEVLAAVKDGRLNEIPDILKEAAPNSNEVLGAVVTSLYSSGALKDGMKPAFYDQLSPTTQNYVDGALVARSTKLTAAEKMDKLNSHGDGNGSLRSDPYTQAFADYARQNADFMLSVYDAANGNGKGSASESGRTAANNLVNSVQTAYTSGVRADRDEKFGDKREAFLTAYDAGNFGDAAKIFTDLPKGDQAAFMQFIGRDMHKGKREGSVDAFLAQVPPGELRGLAQGAIDVNNPKLDGSAGRAQAFAAGSAKLSEPALSGYKQAFVRYFADTPTGVGWLGSIGLGDPTTAGPSLQLSVDAKNLFRAEWKKRNQ